MIKFLTKYFWAIVFAAFIPIDYFYFDSPMLAFISFVFMLCEINTARKEL